MSNQDATHVARLSLVAGAMSGMLGVAVGFPLETLRVRLQTQRLNDDFKGPWDCLVKTVRGEGLRGLYKGMASPLFGATLTKTVNFGTYGGLVALMDGAEPRPAAVMAAGMLSAVTASLVLTPVDRVKILLQVQRSVAERARAEGGALPETATGAARPLFAGPAHVGRTLGVAGLYRGAGVTALREAVYGALYFSLFTTLRAEAQRRWFGAAAAPPFHVLLACGGLTGMAVWTVIFPLDVLKSRVQASLAPPLPLARVARQLFRLEGAAGFYKGLSAALVRAFPAHAVVLASYSQLMSLFIPNH